MGKAGVSCMNFTRSVTDYDLGYGKKGKPANHINTVTNYLDLSNVYGLNKETSDTLRSFKGGKLLTEVRDEHVFPPTNDELLKHCPCNLPDENVCYKTGKFLINL